MSKRIIQVFFSRIHYFSDTTLMRSQNMIVFGTRMVVQGQLVKPAFCFSDL